MNGVGYLNHLAKMLWPHVSHQDVDSAMPLLSMFVCHMYDVKEDVSDSVVMARYHLVKIKGLWFEKLSLTQETLQLHALRAANQVL